MKEDNRTEKGCFVVAFSACGIVLIIPLILYILSSCSYINSKFNLEDDNIAEEIIEQLVESQIGLDIDFSPSSAE